jgi:hypothetical protein
LTMQLLAVELFHNKGTKDEQEGRT